eukprot:scpid16975/ scgid9644/ Oxysterol-binding protein-related protein 1
MASRDSFHDCVDDEKTADNFEDARRSDELTPEKLDDCELLLQATRQGSFEDVQALLGRAVVNVNYAGRNRAYLGWGAIHIAAYFGHLQALKLLLKNGANINLQNASGDTALHKAAFTARMNIVLELLRCEADVRIINANGDRPIDVAQSEDITEALKAADRRLQFEEEQTFLRAAAEGDISVLKDLLSSTASPDLQCVDSLGNTALHNAAYRGHADVIVLLFQQGVDASICNKEGKTPSQVACSAKIRALLDIKPVQAAQKPAQRFEGFLLKKSRFFGKQRCWVVLDQGVLSWFASKSDAFHRKKHLGFKHLADADLATSMDDCNSFKVQYIDHAVQMWTVPTERSTDVDRQRWISALVQHRLHSTREVRPMRSNSTNSADLEDLKPLGSIEECFQNADAHRLVLERQLQEVAQLVHTAYGPSSTQGYHAEVDLRFSQLMTTARDMCAALADTVSIMRQQEEVRRVHLEEEQERCRLLEESLQALAKEHHALEQSLGGNVSPRTVMGAAGGGGSGASSLVHSPVSSVSQYFEAGSDDEFFETRSHVSSRMDEDTASVISESMADQRGVLEEWQPDGYRTSLPCPAISRAEFSLWAFLKECIGKDLSRVTMPVMFNEPLSFTQRVAESLTYAYLLDRASLSDDPVLRLQYVSAFAVSHYACDVFRTGKPFNPLLGETYELEREDLGFRVLCEQVSHHPPVTALHADSANYRLHFSIQSKIKFLGKGVEVWPVGRLTLELLRHNEVYTWNFINTCVHNIIVGKIWVEHFGGLNIHNHSNNLRAHLNFKPCGWFGRDLHVVEGTIQSPSKETLCYLTGKWPEELVALPPSSGPMLASISPARNSPLLTAGGAATVATTTSTTDHGNGNSTSSGARDMVPAGSTAAPLRPAVAMVAAAAVTAPASASPSRGSPAPGAPAAPVAAVATAAAAPTEPRPILKRGSSSLTLEQPEGGRLLWRAAAMPPGYEEFYGMTNFSYCLNEMLAGMEVKLPRTDSRRRPDIRHLEEGQAEPSASEKHRLEEKQRAARKAREQRKDEWAPRWFQQAINPYTETREWVYKGDYWEREKFDECPDIF